MCLRLGLSDSLQYQSIVDAEWNVIYDKLDKCVKSGAKIVLSRLAIGEIQFLNVFCYQYFAERDIFCAGRVVKDEVNNVIDEYINATSIRGHTTVDPPLPLLYPIEMESPSIQYGVFQSIYSYSKEKRERWLKHVLCRLQLMTPIHTMYLDQGRKLTDFIQEGCKEEKTMSNHLKSFASDND
ncbi:hypothetical protein Lser_V15G19511 [Lactuca serriola]